MNRLHPATMIVAFLPKLYDAFRQVLPFLALSFFTGKGDRTELFIAAIGVLGGFGAIAAYWTTRYGIEEGHLVCTTGWLFRRDRSIPLDQIQNVNLKQGLLERFFKVVTLEVETAAGSGSELKLQVVTDEAANALKQQISLSPGFHPTVAAAPSQTVMSWRELVVGAMTENQGSQIVFALLGTIGGAAFIQVGFSLFKAQQLLPSWILVLAVALLILVIWGLGWIYGGVQYAIKYWRFAVIQEPGLLRVSHGLLTKLQLVVRLKRVEVAMVTSTVWQRMVGRVTVRVGTAGSFGEVGTTAPIALMTPQDQSETMLQYVLPGFKWSTLEWKLLPRYYVFAQGVGALISLAIFGALSSVVWFTPRLRDIEVLRMMIPGVYGLLLLYLVIQLIWNYRKLAYAISDDYLATRSGIFTKTIQIMPISKIDTFRVHQSPWWRRRGVTSFHATGMVHHLIFPMIAVDEVPGIQRKILDRQSIPKGFTMNLIEPIDQE